jgi:hypothetical protein
MVITRVWIQYKPQLYTDLFATLLKSLESVEVVEIPIPTQEAEEGEESVDVVVCSLDELGQPDLEPGLSFSSDTKLLAFSPFGDFGFRRMPGEVVWEEIRPFGFIQLVCEVLEGNQPLIKSP